MRFTGAVLTAVAITVSGCTGTAAAVTFKYPAASAEPHAGICDGGGSGAVVTIRLYGDMTEFRCYEVTPRQHLRFVDETGSSVRVEGGRDFPSFTLRPHKSRTLKGRAGSYLAPGDHAVGSSLWCCFGFDILLPGAVAPSGPVG